MKTLLIVQAFLLGIQAIAISLLGLLMTQHGTGITELSEGALMVYLISAWFLHVIDLMRRETK
jgi:hypothetical protein